MPQPFFRLSDVLKISILLVTAGGCRVEPTFPSVVTPVYLPNIPVNISGGGSNVSNGTPGPVPMQGGPVEAGCSFTANELRGEAGTIFQVACPPGCKEVGTLWGSDTYTGDSSLCRGAIHAGAIPPNGGVVTVRVDPGRPAYRGTVHYGIRSNDYGSYSKSVTVLFAEGQSRLPEAVAPQASQVIEAGCTFTANEIRAEVGTVSVVSCPGGCATAARIWGTDTYTGDSGICIAAVHAGLTSATAGGRVLVTLEPGRPAYRGSVRNSVTSLDFGAYRGSFRLQSAR